MKIIKLYVPVWDTQESGYGQICKVDEELKEVTLAYTQWLEEGSKPDGHAMGDVLEECADLIQASLNLMAKFIKGYREMDFNYWMDRVNQKNLKRGYIS